MPDVKLEMGMSIKTDDIVEGSDVFFECIIKSNPKFYRLTWLHEVFLQIYLCYHKMPQA